MKLNVQSKYEHAFLRLSHIFSSVVKQFKNFTKYLHNFCCVTFFNFLAFNCICIRCERAAARARHLTAFSLAMTHVIILAVVVFVVAAAAGRIAILMSNKQN